MVMKRIIVTPAGRKEYLAILVRYLNYYKNEFDEWHLWCNTDDQSDKNYMLELEKQYSFIKVLPLGINFFPGCFACTIPWFIERDSTDEDTLYLRLDDDIVFIKKNSIKDIFDYRLNNTDNFLVYGNIVNNSVLSSIHQKIGALSTSMGQVEFNSRSQLGLIDSRFAEICHRNFFENYYNNNLNIFNFDNLILKDFTHTSIQVISWWGKEFKKFNGIIPVNIHEEDYVAQIRPQELGIPNIIFGNSLFCHYSSQYTRDYLKQLDILSAYEKVAGEYLR